MVKILIRKITIQFWLFFILFFVLSGVTQAPVVTDDAVYYSIQNGTPIYQERNTARQIASLSLRETVEVLSKSNGLSYIRTQNNITGYVPSHLLSNVWIRASKSKQKIYVYEGATLIKAIPADFGYNLEDKEYRGTLTDKDQWRTPEGVFFICNKNPNSQYYKALVLNYPASEDATRGYQNGLISSSQYYAIINAEKNFQTPPMNTALGGMIEIHGHGTSGRSNWTRGCIAIRDLHIDDIWDMVHVGTPVVVES